MISPPPGFVKDPNSETWWLDPAGDPNDVNTWWEMPPPGYVEDQGGWYYDPTKDIAHDPTAWHHVNKNAIEDPATRSLSYWTLEEIGAAANVPVYPNVSDNWPHICRAAALWGVDDPLTLIGMLGTMMKETSSLYPVREAWWVWNVDQAAAIRYYNNVGTGLGQHAAYGGGWQYHGRGYVQLTHSSGYANVQGEMATKGIAVDLIGNPDLMLVPEYSAHAIAIFFISKGLPELCQQRNWTEVRRRVWGAYGDSIGVGYLQRCDAMLSPLAVERGVL